MKLTKDEMEILYNLLNDRLLLLNNFANEHGLECMNFPINDYDRLMMKIFKEMRDMK